MRRKNADPIRWREFFQDTNGALSSARLLMFMAFFPAAWVVIDIHTPDVLWPFLGAFTTSFVGSKYTDMLEKRGPPDAANVNINQPNKVNIPGDNT